MGTLGSWELTGPLLTNQQSEHLSKKAKCPICLSLQKIWDFGVLCDRWTRLRKALFCKPNIREPHPETDYVAGFLTDKLPICKKGVFHRNEYTKQTGGKVFGKYLTKLNVSFLIRHKIVNLRDENDKPKGSYILWHQIINLSAASLHGM